MLCLSFALRGDSIHWASSASSSSFSEDLQLNITRRPENSIFVFVILLHVTFWKWKGMGAWGCRSVPPPPPFVTLCAPFFRLRLCLSAQLIEGRKDKEKEKEEEEETATNEKKKKKNRKMEKKKTGRGTKRHRRGGSRLYCVGAGAVLALYSLTPQLISLDC